MRRVAVFGCGHWGLNLVRNFFQLGCLAFVVDPRPEVVAKLREVAPGVPLYSELDESRLALCDAVVVATPAPTHYQLCRRLLLADKDVYVEKPLALKLSEGEELTSLAEQRNRILMVGHLLEYHDCFVTLLDLVRSGQLGKLRYLYSNRLSLGIIRFEEDVLWSLASHDVEVITRLVGEAPLTVSAQKICQLRPDIADFATLQMTFRGGIGAHLFVSWLHPQKEQRLFVVGTKRSVCFDGVKGQLTVYPCGVDPMAGNHIHKGEMEVIPTSGKEALRSECQAFLEAIQKRSLPLTDGVCGCGVLSVLEAAQRSAKSGQLETVAHTLVI